MTKLNPTDNHYRLAIKEINKLNKTRKFLLLEVGAGAKTIKNFLPKNIIYHTLDNAENFWKQKYTFNYDLNKGKFPIKDNIYDIIICNDVLEHVLYPEKVIREMIRVAKKNAVFFFSMPNEYNFVMRFYYLFEIKTKTEEPFKVVEKGLHIHKPRVKDIIDLFSKYFKVIKIEYIWQSRRSEKSFLVRYFDKLFDILAKIYPALFARVVVVKAEKKT